MEEKTIKFHWRLIHAGETTGLSRAQQLEASSVAYPEVDKQADYSNLAHKLGFESLLTDFSFGKPDPLLMAAGIAPLTEHAKFLIAIRSGLISPTYYAQQVNTFSSMFNGRILLNIVAGHSPIEQAYYGDYLPHDERYARTEEFLTICNALWHKDQPFTFKGKYYEVTNTQLYTKFKAPDRKAPYLFIAGGSQQAANLAISQGDCWMRLADTPNKIKSSAQPVLAAGKEVGLRLSTIIRSTKAEAIAASEAIVKNKVIKSFTGKQKKFVQEADSVSIKKVYQLSSKEWLTPWLWTGAVKTDGAPAISFVGTPEEIAHAIMEYKKAGITQYILSGWPKLEEMILFGEQVIPLVRELEEKEKRGLSYIVG